MSQSRSVPIGSYLNSQPVSWALADKDGQAVHGVVEDDTHEHFLSSFTHLVHEAGPLELIEVTAAVSDPAAVITDAAKRIGRPVSAAAPFAVVYIDVVPTAAIHQAVTDIVTRCQRNVAVIISGPSKIHLRGAKQRLTFKRGRQATFENTAGGTDKIIVCPPVEYPG